MPRTTIGSGFRLGELQVDLQAGEVTGPGGRVQLDPKVMGVLGFLADRAGKVVPREDLISRLWPDVVVTDDALSRCLYDLRRQLAVAGGTDEYRALIETLPKRGYRLNGIAEPVEATAPARPKLRKRPWLWAAGLSAAAILIAGALLSRDRNGSDPSAESVAQGAAPRIAVLPFDDMSEAQDQQYFADGLAEEILERLSQSTDLDVIARTSSFWFRGKDADIADIARKLAVTHVLEGSVRRSGDRLRVTAQLVATNDSAHVWSTTFERETGDVFAIQDEIAGGVATALKSTLEHVSQGPASRPDLAAFDLVKQGEYHYNRRAPGDISRAVELFRKAVQADPRYARAWAALAGAYAIQAWELDPPSALLRARQGEAALRAVELEPTLALAQARLGKYYWDSGDLEAGRRHFDLAQQLDPDDSLVLSILAGHALAKDDLRKAIDLQSRALVRDPMNPGTRQNMGFYLLAAGRQEEALAAFRTALEMHSGMNPDAEIEIEIARILVLLGRFDDAATAAARLPAGKYQDQALALLGKAPRHRPEADAALARLETHVPAPPTNTPGHTTMDAVRLAEAYVSRGWNDKAFAALIGQRDALASSSESATYTWVLRIESRLSPFLKPLHADPRWAALLGESG
jgi:TolB-like protein/DNA-binding winged helix-turn-helix (wHTH) protein/thioredoxin-like negative regulator of GroEL